MTTKEYLSQISRFDRMIKNKLTELAQLKELSYGLSAIPSEERVQTTPNQDKIGTVCAKIDEMEKRLDKIIDDYADKKETIILQIDGMEDETLYDILFLRYISKKTFEKIATEIGYSFKQVTRLHGKALQEFEKKYGHLYLKIENVSKTCPEMS